MALQLTVDREGFEQLDEDDREKYLEQEDGSFRLKQKYREDDSGGGSSSMSPEDIKDLQDHNKRLQKAMDSEREERRKLEREMRGLKSFFDERGGMETVAERLTEAQQLEQARLEKKGEWETLRAQMQEQHAQELAGLKETITNLRGVIDQQMRGRAVMEAIAKADGNPTLLQPILLQKTKLVGDPEAGEDLRVEVFDGDMPLVDADGNRLSIEGYVKRLREDESFSGAFKGTGNSGGGASGDGAAGGTGSGAQNGGGMPPELANFRRSTASPRERVAMLRHLSTQHESQQEVDAAYLALPE